MVNSHTTKVLLRDALREISALVTYLGSSSKIEAFDEVEVGGDRFKRLAQLQPGEVVVFTDRGSLPNVAGSHIHQFAVCFRAKVASRAEDLDALIINGSVGGAWGGQAFQTLQLSNDFLPVQFVDRGPRILLVGDDSRVIYWQQTWQVMESGLL